jgi:formylglycine-generating enzyme required for sulfatase activity
MSILFGLLLFSGCNKSAVGPVLPAAVGEARVPRAADPTEAKVIKGNGYQAVKIPKGTFMMGALDNDEEALDREKPAHEVTITYDFYMMTTEVTQDLYKKVTGSKPSKFKGKDRPVEYVSWTDAVRFANELSRKEGLEECYAISESGVSWPKKLDCLGWRLPTEAEWEYAAKANQGFKYAGSDNIEEVAWYWDNSNGETHGVGQKKANGFGLFDMTGNVLEWCWDWYGEYSSSPTEDPTGPTTGTFRMSRGWGWDFDGGRTRLSYRSWGSPSGRGNYLGFRLSRTIP